MYEAAYGLTRSPFTVTPDPASLYLTPAHREALAGLMYGVLEKKGFIVLIGDSGTGKTTLLRKLMLMLPGRTVESSVLINPAVTPSDFLEMVLEDFRIGAGAQSKAQRLVRMRDFLIETHRTGKTALLVLDEAHRLSADVLEEVRLLTNFETDRHKLLQIVLAGQTELRDILNREDLRQLKQRIAVRLELIPLSLVELRNYIQFRWSVSGGTEPAPFESTALEEIARWSCGVPRLVNTICDGALLLACGDGVKTIGKAHVLEVVKDLDLRDESGARPPLAVPSRPAADPAASVNGKHTTVTRHEPQAPKNGVISKLPGEGFPVLPTLERYAREQHKSLFGRWTSKSPSPVGAPEHE